MKIKDCFRYRSVWMGIAIIWVMIYHLQINWNVGSDFLNRGLHIIEKHHYGVDIFFFASGIGCYYSLKKDENPYRFIIRRAKKIMPVYIPTILIWYCYLSMTEQCVDILSYVRTIFCVTNVTGGVGFNWYMTAIWVAYFLAPFLKGWVDSCDKKREYIFLIIMLFLFSISFWHLGDHIKAASRYPIFALGMICAKYEEVVIDRNKKILAIILGLTVETLMVYIFRFDRLNWEYGLMWYIAFFAVPPLVMLISIISARIENNTVGRIIVKFLEIIGSYSFELYLSHIIINNIYDGLVERGIISWENKYIIPFFAITAIFALIITYIGKSIKSVCEKFA